MVAETCGTEEAVPGSSLPRQSHEVVEGAWPHVSQQQELARLLGVPTAHSSHLPNAALLMRVPTLPPPHRVPRLKQACREMAGTHCSVCFPWKWRASWAPPKPDPALAAQGMGILRSVQADGHWCHAQRHQCVPVRAAVLQAHRRVNMLGALPMPLSWMQGLGALVPGQLRT